MQQHKKMYSSVVDASRCALAYRNYILKYILK